MKVQCGRVSSPKCHESGIPEDHISDGLLIFKPIQLKSVARHNLPPVVKYNDNNSFLISYLYIYSIFHTTLLIQEIHSVEGGKNHEMN